MRWRAIAAGLAACVACAGCAERSVTFRNGGTSTARIEYRDAAGGATLAREVKAGSSATIATGARTDGFDLRYVSYEGDRYPIVQWTSSPAAETCRSACRITWRGRSGMRIEKTI